MRAGLLREKLVFRMLTNEQSPSGAISQVYREIYRCRAYRQRTRLIINNGAIDAHELFNGNRIVFQVRYAPKIREGLRVSYAGREYSLVNVEPKYDRTLLLTIEKINE